MSEPISEALFAAFIAGFLLTTIVYLRGPHSLRLAFMVGDPTSAPTVGLLARSDFGLLLMAIGFGRVEGPIAWAAIAAGGVLAVVSIVTLLTTLSRAHQ